ncbi:alkaline phosphatase [Gimesia panareensis]|uniref:Alkaline phosphatase 4 n=1 Tax=Gimesia panareensis TaxID=2527978 RepID=A0A517Q109_9PLAN|nr:alkaline phosphatase [Gimesia panareensis]QDT25324.1 Alkaline phosphatase 4 precursor [Gimesia panareensis]QDU48280.1 Alkaline phosphatase 4 precursor [Gimesia panareensis]
MKRAVSASLFALVLLAICSPVSAKKPEADHIRKIQTEAIRNKKSPIAHWGFDPENYTQWSTHSLRLIPVYTFGTKDAGQGIDLNSYTGQNSPYRNAKKLESIYGYLPENSVNATAEYLDQTNLYNIQEAALKAGKKNIILVVFDGMDWQTTRAAALYYNRADKYQSGRGTGLYFQDYPAAGTSQFGFMVTAPHNAATNVDVDKQSVLNPGGKIRGGYNAEKGGPNPWTPGKDKKYLIGSPSNNYGEHAYPDSANTATSMTAGIKSYNNAINVDPTGAPVTTIAHQAQQDGYAIGVVTSVPITHATPAAAYAHNVSRNDYQDIARDLVGQSSISHPNDSLPGLDVVLGGGFGTMEKKSGGKSHGKNFVPGWKYISEETIEKADVKHGGKYTVALRSPGVSGKTGLQQATQSAIKNKTRLLGVYGVGNYAAHLPFQTADGDYQPAPGLKNSAEKYSTEDIKENPTLADMTESALDVLSQNKKGFWLLVEAGDVDWANHDNNLDNSIGAVKSGEAAFKVITDWVEKHSNWQDTVVILTADHGHYLHIDQPEALIPPKEEK